MHKEVSQNVTDGNTGFEKYSDVQHIVCQPKNCLMPECISDHYWETNCKFKEGEGKRGTMGPQFSTYSIIGITVWNLI